ncbi:MFS general substrate transporter [Martensiomyces pterosporus]|nr:MFS general substrate transporter [Martensiomyces pterosporus]
MGRRSNSSSHSGVATPDQPLLDSAFPHNGSLSDEHPSSFESGEARRRLSSSSSSGELTDFERAWSQRKWSYQLLALACALLISVGSHYSAHTLGALKSTIKKELDITNTQYGALQSTVSAVNTILPVLGGLFIDAFGTTAGSLIATSLIMFGNLIISISTHNRSFSAMVAGRILYGLGSGTITVVQETILGSWFKGKGLAITIAIQITTSRIASFLSMGTAIPIADRFGFYGAAFWANFVVCAVSFGINLVYMVTMRRIHSNTPEQAVAKLRRKHTFNPRLVFFLFGLYWLIVVQSFTLGGGWNSFLHINSELIKLRFGVNDSIAAWSASVSQIMPIFLVPFLGWFFDHFGLRTDMLVVSTSMFTISMVLLGFTMVNPLVGSVVFSVSLALGPLSEITAISLLLPTGSLGTGLGIYKSAMNIGSTIVDIVVGALQDHGPKVVEETKNSYRYAMAFFVIWGSASTIVAVVIFVVDRYKWSSLLRSNAQDRREAQHAVKDKINKPLLFATAPNWRSYAGFWNCVPLAVFSFLLVASWVLFAMKLA